MSRHELLGLRKVLEAGKRCSRLLVNKSYIRHCHQVTLAWRLSNELVQPVVTPEVCKLSASLWLGQKLEEERAHCVTVA